MMAKEAVCGENCSDWCESVDPAGCSLRTSLRSELAALTGFSLIWKRKATPAGRSWWVLGRSEPRTEESASGLWRTVQSGDGTHNHGEAPAHQRGTVPLMLTLQVRRIGYQGRKDPTKKGTQKSLTTQAVDLNFPSPKASDGRSKGTGGTPDHGLDAMARAGLLDPGSHSTSGRSRAWPSPAAQTQQGGPRLEGGAAGRAMLKGTELEPGTYRGVLNSRWVAQLLGYLSSWCDVWW